MNYLLLFVAVVQSLFTPLNSFAYFDYKNGESHNYFSDVERIEEYDLEENDYIRCGDFTFDIGNQDLNSNLQFSISFFRSRFFADLEYEFVIKNSENYRVLDTFYYNLAENDLEDDEIIGMNYSIPLGYLRYQNQAIFKFSKKAENSSYHEIYRLEFPFSNPVSNEVFNEEFVNYFLITNRSSHIKIYKEFFRFSGTANGVREENAFYRINFANFVMHYYTFDTTRIVPYDSITVGINFIDNNSFEYIFNDYISNTNYRNMNVINEMLVEYESSTFKFNREYYVHPQTLKMQKMGDLKRRYLWTDSYLYMHQSDYDRTDVVSFGLFLTKFGARNINLKMVFRVEFNRFLAIDGFSIKQNLVKSDWNEKMRTYTL